MLDLKAAGFIGMNRKGGREKNIMKEIDYFVWVWKYSLGTYTELVWMDG